MKHYSIKAVRAFPQLPFKGSLDLTYRCNFNCRHCWLRIPPGAPEKREELSFDEIRVMVDESRLMGCREWALSGGEPMLRPDFLEIFDYLTRKAVSYSLNTNGSLITPKIAQLLRRKGTKMVALYGATAEVYDHVTRTPGSFEQTMRGIAYLQEAGAGFTVQLTPMRANYHQWDEMVSLAKSLSPQWRVGAAWLYLSSEGSPPRNAGIIAQRLDPREVILLDPPNLGYDERVEDGSSCDLHIEEGVGKEFDDRLFIQCIAARREFHIDAYGMMSWCSYIKDPALRYDLRRGTFREAWEEFIPAVADKVRGGDEYRSNCGVCERRVNCRWCAAYAYLETGRYDAPIPYLCAVAEGAENYKVEWQNKHRRYFQIAGINVRVESDLDFGALEFKEEFIPFGVEGPGEDNVIIRHYFELPDLKGKNLGQVLYRKPPWEISRKNGIWFYRGIQPDDTDLSCTALRFLTTLTHI